MSATELGAPVPAVRSPTVRVPYGPWAGSMRSVQADAVPTTHMADGQDYIYLPRSGWWRRRSGQTIKFDTIASGHEATGLLPTKWGAKCRQLEEFVSDFNTDAIPSVIALLTKETIASGLDDGRFSCVYVRDQVGNAHYTLGSEYSGTVYPAVGTEQTYKVVPLWYDSGDGGLTRGVSEFARRFFASGARSFMKAEDWWYWPSYRGTPFRWNGLKSTATVRSRIMPTGPIAPTHPGTIAAGTQITTGIAFARPDGDISVNGWRNQAASATNLYQSIDESTVNDADWIRSASGTSDDVCEFSLENLGVTPTVDDTVSFSIRIKQLLAWAYLQVDIVQGTTVKATQNFTLSTNVVHTALTLTAAQISSITDWTDVRIRFTKKFISNAVDPTGANARAYVTYAALEFTPSLQVALEGGWRGADTFYYAVAYRYRDGSVWFPSGRRGPNATLSGGFGLFTVDAANMTAGYQSLTWSNLPIPPADCPSKLLLRTTKTDLSTENILQCDINDLRIVDEVDASVTTYVDTKANDDTLTIDPNGLIVRDDLMMAPPARYVVPGVNRMLHSYVSQSPVAIELAPVGRAADYDLNLADTSSTAYTSAASYVRLALATDGTYTLVLILATGAAITQTKTITVTATMTLQDLVDTINATTVATDSLQWRAQVSPNADPNALVTNLLPHWRLLTNVVVTSGQATVTRAAGGLTKIAVGSIITDSSGAFNANFADGTYVLRVDSDTQVTMSAAASGTATATAGFSFDLGDRPTASDVTYQRVISNSLPGFLYFCKTYLGTFPNGKSTIFMTSGTPGAAKCAPNLWSADSSNRFTAPDSRAGICMGGRATGRGFVVPFSRQNAAISNYLNPNATNFDRDYQLRILNAERGCCAWQSLAAGNDCVFLFTPEGWIACDTEREVAISEATYNQSPALGDYTYEAPLSIAATAQDNDSAYLIGNVVRGVLRCSYRASGAHPNREVWYDFSAGHASNGLGSLVRDRPLVDPVSGRIVARAGEPWGWSEPLARSITCISEGRRSDGSHVYGWNEQNQGSTGDGRLDELDTGDDDNGTAISASLNAGWLRFGSDKVSFQELRAEHKSPAASTVAPTVVRGFTADAYTLTPTVGSGDPTGELFFTTLAGRTPADAVRFTWVQTAGAAGELRRVEMRVKPLRRLR